MSKRTMFSRIITLNIVSMFICIIIMGSAQTIMFTNYLTKQNEDYLSDNAETIVDVINGNVPIGSINSMINGFSRVMGSYIMIVDAKGRVIAQTSHSENVNNPPLFLKDEYTKTVMTGKKTSLIGNVGNVFNQTMYTLQVPITSRDKVMGAVSISLPMPEHQRMRYETFQMILISMLIIAIVSAILSYFLAKGFSVPMKNMSETTREFAKGNFSARVSESAEKSNINEIAELAEAFNNMASELEKAEEIKNTFISDVSHELRTPMTTISGFVSGMLDDTIPKDEQKEYLKIVHSEITRLSRLVNTFLDITRIQSDKMVMDMKNFDINEVIRIAIISHEKRLNEKNIYVELNFHTENSYVYADKDSITRVIRNLIDNAVKFTNNEGVIKINVCPKEKDIEISVYNTGKGIPGEQLDMIFNRFYKTDKSRSENKEGTGIGLYLVKNILNAHGKEIRAKSEEGKYAEFIFTLNKGKSTSNRNKDNI